MLTKKEKWLIRPNQIYEPPVKVTAMLDDNRKPISYEEQLTADYKEWRLVEGDELFYDSEEKAIAARKKIVSEFLKDVKKVRQACDMYYRCWKENLGACRNLFKTIGLDDVFGVSLASVISESNREERRRVFENRIIEKLEQYISHGYITIAGVTFRPADVKRIEWGSEPRLYMTDGSMVEIDNTAEYEMLSYVFGYNTSHKPYQPKKGENEQ